MARFTGTNAGEIIGPEFVSTTVKVDPAGSFTSLDADQIYASGGNDSVNGAGGADTIQGGDGADGIGCSVNSAEVGPAAFTGIADFHGGPGDDTVYADFFGKDIDLANATFRLYGDAGNDEIRATMYFPGEVTGQYGAATDVLFGGAGDDTLIVQESGDRVVEKASEGRDTVIAYNCDYTLPANVEQLMLESTGGRHGLGNILDNVIKGTIYGGDVLNGGAGNDTIYGSVQGSYGGDTIHGGAGNDTIYSQAPEYDALDRDPRDVFYGDGGDDEIFGSHGDDWIHGGTGNDKLWGQADNDILYGDDGNDRMGGGSGNDKLYGGAGNDVVSGTGGADQLSGGPGNDRYDWDYVTESTPGSATRDVILDYNGVGAAVGDRIGLSTIDANTSVSGNQAFVFKGTGAFTGAGQVHLIASGTDTLIQANTGGTTAPELEILVHDGAALPTQWVAGDFIL